MSDDENAELVHDWESDCYVLRDEITRLRADLAAVTEERDRMREALKRIDGMATTICMRADAGYGMTVETVMPIYETARAALEGMIDLAEAANLMDDPAYVAARKELE